MIEILVIGIGSGSPIHLTEEARRAMNRVDVFLVADKGPAKRDLAVVRRELCRAVIDHDHFRFVEVPDPARDRTSDDYDSAVQDWHAARVDAYRSTIAADLPEGGTVGFLVWGDPAFYDSTIRIAAELCDDVRVVPGISSLQLLAAAHRIVLNQIGQPIHITTGRRLLAEYTPELGDVLVMLDGDLACEDLVPLYPDLQIFWGAQLGLPSQALAAGRLAEQIDAIRSTREALRSEHGWVLDTYLLRHTGRRD
jgi:precorrin-6A synthase